MIYKRKNKYNKYFQQRITGQPDRFYGSLRSTQMPFGHFVKSGTLYAIRKPAPFGILLVVAPVHGRVKPEGFIRIYLTRVGGTNEWRLQQQRILRYTTCKVLKGDK